MPGQLEPQVEPELQAVLGQLALQAERALEAAQELAECLAVPELPEPGLLLPWQHLLPEPPSQALLVRQMPQELAYLEQQGLLALRALSCPELSGQLVRQALVLLLHQQIQPYHQWQQRQPGLQELRVWQALAAHQERPVLRAHPA